MPDLYLGIANASYEYLNVEEASLLPDLDSLINLSRDMYNYVANSGDIELRYAGRSVEFHSFGVVGAPGGELLAPMIWSISHFGQFFCNLVKAKVGLVIGGVPEIIFAAQSLETVYTANTTPVGIMNEVFDTSGLGNVTTLSWVQMRGEMPPLDIANVVINNLVDDNVTLAIMQAIKPDGLFIVTNASNGSELYSNSTLESFSESVHNLILSTGEFDSYHIQGYTSFTCFRKKSTG